MNETNAQARRWLILTAVLAIAFIGWGVYGSIRHHGLIKVDVLVVPDDSTLKLDGRKIKAGSVYLQPGEHKLVASRQLFDDDIVTIDTGEITKNDKIYLLPKAVGAAAKQWLADHPKVQAERESAGGAEAAREHDLLLKKYPFLADLPHENSHYKVDYGVDANNKLSLQVTLYGILNGPDDYARYQNELKQNKAEAQAYLKKQRVPDSVPVSFTP